MIRAIYEVEWTEFERGWGQRPDGVSYHISLEEAETYIKKSWNPTGPVPDCYSQPSKPKLTEVNEELYKLVQKEKTTWK